MTVKPLHVQVAEALGCSPVELPYSGNQQKTWWSCGCGGSHNYQDGPPDRCLLDYDTDWAATGPLIEKYGASLEFMHGPLTWTAWTWLQVEGGPIIASPDAPTPLLATCYLILELAKQGKLGAHSS